MCRSGEKGSFYKHITSQIIHTLMRLRGLDPAALRGWSPKRRPQCIDLVHLMFGAEGLGCSDLRDAFSLAIRFLLMLRGGASGCGSLHGHCSLRYDRDAFIQHLAISFLT
ncbi:hypothetical protein FGO68_gene5283 [Halteria grandinella]|uniref:Uncharacterized protein n=1 Tax=Halteria grandinella TaxID=5974 RepID=A0A8J8P3Z4_HALGN|nr:hypothetical protein FGO68_gene5283 [Halteria grandinella]